MINDCATVPACGSFEVCSRCSCKISVGFAPAAAVWLLALAGVWAHIPLAIGFAVVHIMIVSVVHVAHSTCEYHRWCN
jgi:hypothetical protein